MSEIPYGYCQCGCGNLTKRWTCNDSRRNRIKGEPARYLDGHQNRKLINIGIEKVFWSRVAKTNGCWEWQSYKRRGYGSLVFGGKTLYAHRISYELAYGPFPKELDVLHKCDNTSCVRPDHLFLGTQTDNNKDMISKGRGVQLNGENHSRSKLDNAKVIEIRRKYKTGRFSQMDLAIEYNISKSVIQSVITNKTWRHVND